MTIIYTRDNCMPCKMTKREFDRAGLAYQEVNLDVASEQELATIRESGFMSAPVVLADNGDKWSGFAPTKIRALVS